MLLETALDVAAWKMEVAAQEVNAGELLVQAEIAGGGFGALEIGEGTVEVHGHPPDRGRAEPGAAASAIVAGGFESGSKCLPGFGQGPKVMKDVAAQAGQLEPMVRRAGQR